MKINLNRLSSEANSSTESSVNKLNLDALKTKTTANTPASTQANTASAPKLNLTSLQSSQTATPTVPTTTNTNVDSDAIRDQEESLNAYSVKFTEGVTYDLDDIIFAKRRDNADCPLIVQYRDENENDNRIVAEITKLILSDYNVDYSTDATSTQYFENIVYKVPDFYKVFTVYFNRYYDIYYKQLTGIQEGALSLSSVIETIQTSHDEVYENLLNSEEKTTLYTALSGSKSQVEYDFGTMPTEDDYNPSSTGGDALVEKFSLEITDDDLVLKYDDEIIENCSVSIDDIADVVFDFNSYQMELYEDIGDISDFTATDVVIANISNSASDFIEATTVTI